MQSRKRNKSVDQEELSDGLSKAAQFIRVSSLYTKVVGSIPGEGKYKNQLMNA